MVVAIRDISSLIRRRSLGGGKGRSRALKKKASRTKISRHLPKLDEANCAFLSGSRPSTPHVSDNGASGEKMAAFRRWGPGGEKMARVREMGLGAKVRWSPLEAALSQAFLEVLEFTLVLAGPFAQLPSYVCIGLPFLL